jgi:glycosyltransferase involved in cell wall biosynthesis
VEECFWRRIQGLQAQTLPPDEILVIDDGLRDSSPQIAPSDAGVMRMPHPAKKGLAAARSTAFRAARSEFVALDDDYVPEPTWLVELVKQLADPTAAGVGGNLTGGCSGAGPIACGQCICSCTGAVCRSRIPYTCSAATISLASPSLWSWEATTRPGALKFRSTLGLRFGIAANLAADLWLRTT